MGHARQAPTGRPGLRYRHDTPLRALCTLVLSAALALPATAAHAASAGPGEHATRPALTAVAHHRTDPGPDNSAASGASSSEEGATSNAPTGDGDPGQADGPTGAAEQWPDRLPGDALPTGLPPFPDGASSSAQTQGDRGTLGDEPSRAAAEAEQLAEAARRKGERPHDAAREATQGVAPGREPSTARPPVTAHADPSATQRPTATRHSDPGRSAGHRPAGKPAPRRDTQRQGPSAEPGERPDSRSAQPSSPSAKPHFTPSEQALPYADEDAPVPPSGTRASTGRESLVLPLGAGFTLIGLGLGFLGYRLRRG